MVNFEEKCYVHVNDKDCFIHQKKTVLFRAMLHYSFPLVISLVTRWINIALMVDYEEQCYVNIKAYHIKKKP